MQLEKTFPVVQRHLRSLFAVIAAIAIITLMEWISDSAIKTSASRNYEPPKQLLADTIGSSRFNTLDEAAAAPIPRVDSTVEMPPHLQVILDAGDYDLARTELLERAMQAVNQHNDLELANTITLLGLAALTESDTDTGSVYLNEALALYEELDDQLGVANVNLQLGRLHIIERRKARRAALAYDASLLARWKIANGMFREAEASLLQAIQDNLELNRYGAAAIDYETLYQGYLAEGNMVEAESSAIAAARVHASSGRIEQAETLIARLNDSGMFAIETDELMNDLRVLGTQYESSVNQIGRARDYSQLYNHFIAENDPVRAWQFRLQANESLRKASRRARYRRQTGVLVLLYNSNDNMREARSSLKRAHDVFNNEQHPLLVSQSLQLLDEVY